MKPRICLSLAVAMLLALGAGAAETQCPYRMGLLQEDPHTVPGLVELTRIPVAPGAPDAALLPSVDLSSEMPPVGNQAGQGSCVAWSVGYYDKTHTEYVEHGWNDSLLEHQVSPAFIYNQINGGRDGGSNFYDAYQLICEQGACMLSDFPYDPSDYASWPSESAYSRGILYRGTAAYYIDVTTDAGINSVKQRLANGQTCVLGISCYDNMFYIKNFDNTYTVYDKYGINHGGHGVCIVGYDDNKDTKDGIGVFKLVNSWGTGWGDKGYWWMSYYAVKDKRAGLSWGNVYYAGDRIDYHPTLLGRVRLTHSARDCIGITFGIGRSKAPAWTYAFRKFKLLDLVPQSFPLNNMVFDLSDGAAYLEPTDSVYVRCSDSKKDAKTGSIDFLSAEHQAKSGISPQTPVPIPDFKTAAFAKLMLLPHAFGPQAEPVTISQSGIELLPNPVKAGRVTVQYALPRAEPLKVTVCDVSGRTVRTEEVSATRRTGALSIDLSGLNAGVYVVRITGADLTASRKLVVQR